MKSILLGLILVFTIGFTASAQTFTETVRYGNATVTFVTTIYGIGDDGFPHGCITTTVDDGNGGTITWDQEFSAHVVNPPLDPKGINFENAHPWIVSAIQDTVNRHVH